MQRFTIDFDGSGKLVGGPKPRHLAISPGGVDDEELSGVIAFQNGNFKLPVVR